MHSPLSPPATASTASTSCSTASTVSTVATRNRTAESEHAIALSLSLWLPLLPVCLPLCLHHPPSTIHNPPAPIVANQRKKKSNQKKMNLNLCAIALLLFGSLSVAHSRAVDTVDTVDTLDDGNEVDNSIEAAETPRNTKHRHRGGPFEEEWLKFTKTPPTKLQQTPGATVEIACEIMGSQVPSIQWRVGRIPLSEIESPESNIVSEDAPTAIVRVRSVHIVDHMLSEPRIYTCIGKTGARTIYASTTVHPSHSDEGLGGLGLIVPEKPYQGAQRPRIVYTQKTHLDLMGSNLMLPCKVHARPHAKITWRNNEDKEIVQSERFRVLPSGDLLIAGLKWEDMGNYKCIAHNAVGRDSADTFVYPVLKDED
ncbi:hypothetical protein ACLKA7_017407 [Drosophila subpalustris]